MSSTPDTAPEPYYVSARREDGDFRLLAGPYDTHAAALADVDRASSIAMQLDPKATWYAYGTCRVKCDYREPGILNRRGLMPAANPVADEDPAVQANPFPC